jgi:hypothetical protein
MKKKLLFYINKILYQEAVVNTALNQTALPQVFVPKTSNSFQVNNSSSQINKNFQKILNNTNNIEIKKFLDYIYRYGNDTLYQKIIDKLENKKEIETQEEKYLKDQVDILKRNPEIQKTILKFTRDNNNLKLEQLKDKFAQEDLNAKREAFKNILKTIDTFKKMPSFMQNKVILDYGKELAYDTVQNVVDMFLKDQIKQEVTKTKLAERNKMLREANKKTTEQTVEPTKM